LSKKKNLLCFEVASELRINLAKSDIVPIEEVEDVELASILGCRVSSLMASPFTLWVFYLRAYERQGAPGVRWGFSLRFWA